VAVIQNQGIEIFFEDTGAGRPIVLGHSFLCSGTMWREQVAALGTKFRVINLDLRGHGRSGHGRVFYDVTEQEVHVLAVISKAQAEAWLKEKGAPDEEGGAGQG